MARRFLARKNQTPPVTRRTWKRGGRLLALSLAGLSLCLSSARAETTFEKLRREGAANFGFMAEPPLVYSENGALTGADYAVARHVLQKIGVPNLNGTLQEFQSLIPGLQAGRYDFLTPFIIRPARCKQVLFTSPVYIIPDSFIVRKGNPKNLHSYADAQKQPDIKIGYYAGAIYGQTLKTLGFTPEQTVIVPDQNTALAALRTGRIDAFINTAIGNQFLLNQLQDPELERADPFTQPEIDGRVPVNYVGYSFRPKDRDLRDAFDKELTAFLGTPEYYALVKPFGFTEGEVQPVLGVKTEDLCKG